ncbi:hypothetical protein OUZ56_005653 [Daphnia magna]|uniref:Uncharacterized protein n=1 Tax=Daphnia magna TaxID=35525 RepID=A0ABQ9YTF1_9CRUS|nr:hypothetical protein OUZ56_005653 [Daphnia magna]
MSSIILKSFPDNGQSVSNTNSSVKIPRSCLQNDDGKQNDNLFSLTLSNQQTCPVEWKRLDACRSYRVDLTSEYLEVWTSGTSSLEIFTTQHGMGENSDSENHHTCWGYICSEDTDIDCDLGIQKL